MKIGCPVVGINDSGGARIQEGVVSLGLYGEIFRRNVHASGVIPQISLIMGPCAGGAVYSPAITDFTVMVDQTSHMFITGPDVIKTVTGEDVGVRGARRRAHAQHQVAASRTTWPPTRTTPSSTSRRCCRYLPSNNLDEPAGRSTPPADLDGHRRATARSTRSSRTRPTSPTTCTRSSSTSLDDGEFLEVQPLFAPNIIVGFGRVEGRSVGVVANQPMQFAGTPRHRRLREGRPVRAHLRRVQHPGADLRRRARLPARHRPGVGRHHPPRRQAASTPTPRPPSRWSP